ncbi:MAG: GntR family transcriptional regulator, partial [Chloroflexi bacterium]|nr:GntR family transcriptional regulator [Chloroflexota bacterium]
MQHERAIDWTSVLRDAQGHPRYEVIAVAFERAIADGRLRPGARLPTVRELARELGMSGATVAAAYERLNRRGWTRGEVGR